MAIFDLSKWTYVHQLAQLVVLPRPAPPCPALLRPAPPKGQGEAGRGRAGQGGAGETFVDRLLRVATQHNFVMLGQVQAGAHKST